MSTPNLDSTLRDLMLSWQKNEITEHYIYSNLAKVVKDPHNRQVIEQIAASEAEHAATFKSYTGKEISPNRWQIFIYYWIARLFGLTFGVKLMERGEEGAQAAYAGVSQRIPDVERILEGRLHSAQLQRGKGGPLGPGGRRLIGPIGFVLE